jgi:hypothetical protein
MAPMTERAKWFLPVSIVVLLWMLVGIGGFIVDLMMTPEDWAKLPEGQQQLYASRPAFLYACYAVATVSGIVGAILLVMRRRAAVATLALSLVAVIVQFGYTIWGLDAPAVAGNGIYGLASFIVLAGAGSLWVARKARGEGWLV